MDDKFPMTVSVRRPKTIDEHKQSCVEAAELDALPSWPSFEPVASNRLHEIAMAYHALHAHELESILMARELLMLRRICAK